jgi:type I restriction enzyme S subunit
MSAVIDETIKDTAAGRPFVEHLPLIAGAPGGVKKLRELILELAVRGKLVPQDSEDEPASVLLERIEEEKARCIAEGRMKRGKRITASAVEEPPFELPPSWEWSTLGELAHVNPRNDAPDEVEASFVPMALIGTGFEGAHGQEVRQWQEIKQGFTHFAEGDIAVAKITPCFENSKACVFSGLRNGIGAGTTELHVVRPFGTTLVPRYVLAYLKAPQFLRVGEARMTGTAGQKRLPKKFLTSNPFPLPPLKEQRRIVAKVDELMALCDRLEAQQADAEAAHATLIKTLLDTLTQSQSAADFTANWQRLSAHFDTLFTTESSIDALKQTLLELAVRGKLLTQDPNDEPAVALLKRIEELRSHLLGSGYPNPKEAATQAKKQSEQWVPNGLESLPSGWEWATLMRCSLLVVDCHNKTAPYSASGIPLIRTTNVRNGELNDNDLKFVDEATYQRWSARCQPEPGDIVITREAPMGEVAIIPKGVRLCLGQRMMLARLVPNTLDPHFLLYSLRDPRLMERVQDKPVGATVQHLRVGGVETLLVPVPPLAEQKRIVAKLDELTDMCDRLRVHVLRKAKLEVRLAMSAAKAVVAAV